MKCLIIQSDGEHKGQDGWTPNWYLRECYALQHAFYANSIDCDIWGKRHSNYNNLPDFNRYDIIFCIENYEIDWLPDLSQYKKPLKIQWIIDLHCQDASIYYSIGANYDLILHSTKCLIESYEKMVNKRNLWFPNGVDDRYFVTKNCNKTVDLGFVGSKNASRKDFLENLQQQVNMQYYFATGVDMINLISSFKIHFNKNIGVDINYRTFETIGLGTCLLTNYNPDLEALGFIDNHNCLLYTDFESAIEKYHYALKDEVWREIGHNASILAQKNTYVNRVKQLLNTIGFL